MNEKFFPHFKDLVQDFITRNAKGLKKKLRILEISDFLQFENGKTIILSTIKTDEFNTHCMVKFIGGIVT